LDRKAAGVLVAADQAGRQILASILADCDTDFAATFDEGVQHLKRRRYTHVVVGYLFAESHMFEFARAARELQPYARVLCVKGAGRALDEQARRGLNYALRSLGCDGFVDLTAGEIPEDALPLFNEILHRCREQAASL
jgi:hypothetical protein